MIKRNKEAKLRCPFCKEKIVPKIGNLADFGSESEFAEDVMVIFCPECGTILNLCLFP